MDYLVYLFMRFAYALYDHVPSEKAYGIGSGFAKLVYPLFRARRSLAIGNIIKAGIAAGRDEADRIARCAFGHFAGHLCEAIKIGDALAGSKWEDHFVYDGSPEVWTTLTRQTDRPVMIVSGHHGVWESAVPLISSFRPMIAVARKMNNPYVNELMKKRHFRGNITVISKDKGFTPGVIRQWKESNAAMTLLADQHAGRRHGMKVDFFGYPAGTHTSPARLYEAARAPMLIGSFVREAAFKYRMVAIGDVYEPLLSGDRQENIKRILTELNERMAEVIRRYPEQYLWAHRRWR
jgi:KDO2-lipid IV(A) lauroyltransferase